MEGKMIHLKGGTKSRHSADLAFCPECSAGPGLQLYLDKLFLPVLHISMQTLLAKSPVAQVPQYTIRVF